jgi:uncharacterized protein
MFIEQALKPKNVFGKYILGSLIVILFSFLGQVPMFFALYVKALKTGRNPPQTEEEIYSFFDANITLLLLLLSFAFALIGIVIAVRNLHGQKLRQIITSRPRVAWGRFFFAFAIWAAFTIITTAISYFTSPETFVLQFDPVNFLLLCCVALPLIPIQTSVEELVFRGYLMQGFGLLAKNRWFPLIMTSLIFGGLHFMNPEVEKMGPLVISYYILTGLALGIMTLMDEGTELALGFHAANNLFTALLVTADYSVLKTYAIFKDTSEPSAGIDIILPVVVIYPIVLFIFAKKYKWHSWKQKLTGSIKPADSLDNANGI